MTHCKWLETKHCLQLNQVFTSGLLSLPIRIPAIGLNFELISDQFQQGAGRWLIDAKENTGKSKVAKLHCKTQAVGWAAVLANDGKISFAKRVVEVGCK
jgi:hypothetical protein